MKIYIIIIAKVISEFNSDIPYKTISILARINGDEPILIFSNVNLNSGSNGFVI